MPPENRTARPFTMKPDGSLMKPSIVHRILGLLYPHRGWWHGCESPKELQSRAARFRGEPSQTHAASYKASEKPLPFRTP